jgi:C4-dicarboxylate transporter DctQ subunit
VKAIRLVDEYLEEVILITFLIIIACSMGLQVVMRYVFNNSLSWPDEISKFALVWSTFISLSFSIKKSSALKLDFLVSFLPKSIQKMLVISIDVFIIILCLHLMEGAWGAVAMAMKINARSAAVEMPLAWVYSSAMIGLVLAVIRTIQKLVFDIKSIKNHNQDVTP